MRRAIREHLKDFIAILALVVVGLVVTVLILPSSSSRIRRGSRSSATTTFELKAELSTAQAVTPGQGQTVNIAGVEVGDISEVELEDGHAIVTMRRAASTRR